MDPILGTIYAFAFNFAPQFYTICNGALISIAQNSALYALLGTNYGGNGVVNFGIPDLRGRMPIGYGQGLGLSNYIIGQTGGLETVTLTQNELPMHTHAMTHTISVAPKASSQAATSNVPDVTKVPAVLPTIGAGVNTFTVNGYGTTSDVTLMATPATGLITAAPAGNSMPHTNMQPYLAINYCIAVEGQYPTRS